MARREHSAVELIKKLQERDYAESAVRSVVAALAAEGLQSDDRFAGEYVRNRVEKGYGPVRIKLELRKRGINDDLICLHLDMHEPAWLQRAAHAREKRFGRRLPADFREQAQQMRFLEQRGFSGEQIRKLFRAGVE